MYFCFSLILRKAEASVIFGFKNNAFNIYFLYNLYYKYLKQGDIFVIAKLRSNINIITIYISALSTNSSYNFEDLFK